MMTVLEHTPFRGELRLEEPMARHTTWRVGGPAQRFYRPADIDDLAAFMSELPPEEPVYWLGLGSNLLVRDGGIRGCVIATQGALTGLSAIAVDTIRAEAGVTCAKVARFCARCDLVGAEFLAGIPGTMGGALAMNAGAFGGETWEKVVEVETVDRSGRRRRRARSDYEIGYRTVRGPENEWFVAAHLRLERGDGGKSLARIRHLLDQRGRTQPIGEPSCGSVFRNPPDDYAARLIEQSGLKGACIGQACVSMRHANFIVNRGEARAADIEALIVHVADRVQREHGIRLQPEVCIVGDRDLDQEEKQRDA